MPISINFITYSCIIILTVQVSNAQKSPYHILRYNDDFNYLLLNDSIQKRGREKVKYIPLSKRGKSNVSFGIDNRKLFQYYVNENFGDHPPDVVPDENGWFLGRQMIHADFRFSEKWRLFTQFNLTNAMGKQNIIDEIDKNKFSIHQLFMHYTSMSDKGFYTRIGRQEIMEGSNLFISMREGPNTRLTFDAVYLGWERQSSKFSVFFATPVISLPGVFDDEHIDEYIWSLYSSKKIGRNFLDTYYFGFYTERKKYNYIGGIDRRHTLGVRYWKRQATKLNFNVETMLQLGKFNAQKVFAYRVNLEFKYRNNLGVKSILTPGVAFDITSGDTSPHDDKLNTFNMHYSKPPAGQTAPIGPSNLICLRPYVEYIPFQKLNVVLSYYGLWRTSNMDGSYVSGGAQTRPTKSLLYNSKEKAIGDLLSMELTYSRSIYWSFSIEASHLYAGEYTKETGFGKDISYFSLKVKHKI